jgi:hypothetical protein
MRAYNRLHMSKLGELGMEELITTFQKNSLEEIRISLLKYKSYYFIDLRIFSAPQRGEEKESTSSGIALPVALFPELKNSILEVEKTLMDRKLLGNVER